MLVTGSGLGRSHAYPLAEGFLPAQHVLLLGKRSLHSPNNSHETQSSNFKQENPLSYSNFTRKIAKNFTLQLSQAASNKHHTFPRKINKTKQKRSFLIIRLASEEKDRKTNKIITKPLLNLGKVYHFIQKAQHQQNTKLKSFYFLSICFPFPTLPQQPSRHKSNTIESKTPKLHDPRQKNINQGHQRRPS